MEIQGGTTEQGRKKQNIEGRICWYSFEPNYHIYYIELTKYVGHLCTTGNINKQKHAWFSLEHWGMIVFIPCFCQILGAVSFSKSVQCPQVFCLESSLRLDPTWHSFTILDQNQCAAILITRMLIRKKSSKSVPYTVICPGGLAMFCVFVQFI